MFKFDVNITEQDYAKFNAFNMEESKFGKKLMRTLRLLIGVIGLMAIVMFVTDHDFDIGTLIGITPIVVVVVLMIVFAKPFMRSVNKKTVKKIQKKGKKLYTPVSTVEFLDEYLVETTPESETKLKYSTLDTAYFVREEAVYIYLNIQQAVILPRSCFESQEQWDSFKEFIRGKLEEVIIIEE